MKGEIVLSIVAFFFVLYYVENKTSGEVAFVKSHIDDRKYLVRALPDSQKAADMLASINQKIEQLIEHLKNKYPEDERVKKLIENYNPEAISEGSEDNQYTSYSVNKGEKIVYCLRSKDGSNKLMDLNNMMYIAFHEAGHLAESTLNHTPSFWNTFYFLLTEAVDIGLYTPINYSEKPVNYCGITISSNILYNAQKASPKKNNTEESFTNIKEHFY